jgi:iron complex outermembrane receptor protein
MRGKGIWVFSFLTAGAYAQEKAPLDSTKVLDEVIVHAYATNRSLKETPVALGLVAEKELNRFSNTSVLPAMNTIPGVRMEERSPGSYRFSIRGSTIRSPFGVRDVKFYWNGLPLTDGGGNTYLNLLDFDAFGRAEIIKGPGGSLYGAGTGGVVLLTSPLAHPKKLQFTVSGGSFGLQRYQGKAILGNARRKLFVNYAHQQSDGYRQQSAMRKDAVNLEGNFSLGAQSTLQASVFYTDLYYQTPGGLTQAQYDASPSQARPGPPGPPGAVLQRAAVFNKTFYGATVYESQWSTHWSTRAGLYSSYTDYTNPSIRNYERRTEFNLGGRTDTQYEFVKESWKGKLTAGVEWQHFFSPLTDYNNNSGVRGTVQTDDRLTANNLITFVQAEIDLPRNFYLTLGGSGNFLRYDFNRLAGPLPGPQRRNFDPVFSPRLALLKKVSESFSAYGSVSKGFSAPSLAEVLPSSGVYSNTLAAEQGINYEVGMRGKVLNAISFDLAAYDFELNQAIVGQNNGDHFINAGNTSQKGLETYLSWQTAASSRPQLRAWISYTLTNYRFVNYKPDTINNYSGKKWTGTAPNTLVCGFDINFLKSFYLNLTATYVDRIPVNDLNTFIASDYFLIGSRVGFRNQISSKVSMEIFTGVDNALDQRYSLGNDLNAMGNRYFNAAATRNFYFGIKIFPRLKN